MRVCMQGLPLTITTLHMLATCVVTTLFFVGISCNLVATAVIPQQEQQLLPYARSLRPAGSDGPVFVVSSSTLSSQDQVTLQTLAGALARESPTIYTVRAPSLAHPQPSSDDTTVFWYERLRSRTNITFDATTHFGGDLFGLIKRFRSRITGWIRYDPATNSTNAALIRCAGIAPPGVVLAVGSGANATQSLLHQLGVPMVHDASDETPYIAWQATRGNLSRRGAVFQPDNGGKAAFMSDYAVFARIPTLQAPVEGSEALHAVLGNMDPTQLNAAFGWPDDEHSGVARATQAGAVLHASDFADNLAFHTNVVLLPSSQVRLTNTEMEKDKQQQQQQAVVQQQQQRMVMVREDQRRGRQNKQGKPQPQPQPQRHHTVAFITSDGDNIQLLQHTDFIGPGHFGDPTRGAIPLGWSYSPAMAVLMPAVLDYVRSSLTANDTLSAGPSGMGYAYPQLFPAAQGRLFAAATAELMKRSGQSLLTVIGAVPSAQSLAFLGAQDGIEGIVYLTFGVADQGYAGLNGNVARVENTTVVGTRFSLWGNADEGDKVGVEGLVRGLRQLPKDPNDPNSYSIVVSELGNNYTEIVRAVRLLQADGGFDIVAPEELFARLKTQANGRTQCPLPDGPWAAEAGTLPKCSIDGNGSCRFTCHEIAHLGPLPLPLPVSCNLNVCATDLSLEPGGRAFLCANGTKCPA